MQFPLSAIKTLLKFNFFFLPVFFLVTLLFQEKKPSILDLSKSSIHSSQQFVQSFQQGSPSLPQSNDDQQRKIAQHSQEIQSLRAKLHSYEQLTSGNANTANLPIIVFKTDKKTQLLSDRNSRANSAPSNPPNQQVAPPTQQTTSIQRASNLPASIQPTTPQTAVSPQLGTINNERILISPVIAVEQTAAAPSISTQPSPQPAQIQESDDKDGSRKDSSWVAQGNNESSMSQFLFPTSISVTQINDDDLNLVNKAQQKQLSSLPKNNTESGQDNFIQLANDAAFGLIVADQKGHITYGTYNYRKVQTAIKLLRQGKDPQNAAKRSKISPSVLAQLIKWGDKRPGRSDIDTASSNKLK